MTGEQSNEISSSSSSSSSATAAADAATFSLFRSIFSFSSCDVIFRCVDGWEDRNRLISMESMEYGVVVPVLFVFVE